MKKAITSVIALILFLLAAVYIGSVIVILLTHFSVVG
jgi:uncharacterized membrane protein